MTETVDLVRIMEKLMNDDRLSIVERVFLTEVCDRLYRTDELDHLSERKTQ